MRTVWTLARVVMLIAVLVACGGTSTTAPPLAEEAVARPATHQPYPHRDPEAYGAVPRIHNAKVGDEAVLDHYFFCLEDRIGPTGEMDPDDPEFVAADNECRAATGFDGL